MSREPNITRLALMVDGALRPREGVLYSSADACAYLADLMLPDWLRDFDGRVSGFADYAVNGRPVEPGESFEFREAVGL